MERNQTFFCEVPIGGDFYFLEEGGTKYRRTEKKPSGANALRLGEASSSECKIEWDTPVFVDQAVPMNIAC